MPTIINKTFRSRAYQKGDRYFISQVQGDRLCRQEVDKTFAEGVADYMTEDLDEVIAEVLLVSKKQGANNYFEVLM